VTENERALVAEALLHTNLAALRRSWCNLTAACAEDVRNRCTIAPSLPLKKKYLDCSHE
jgi:hypothetical protein